MQSVWHWSVAFEPAMASQSRMHCASFGQFGSLPHAVPRSQQCASKQLLHAAVRPNTSPQFPAPELPSLERPPAPPDSELPAAPSGPGVPAAPAAAPAAPSPLLLEGAESELQPIHEPEDKAVTITAAWNTLRIMLGASSG